MSPHDYHEDEEVKFLRTPREIFLEGMFLGGIWNGIWIFKKKIEKRQILIYSCIGLPTWNRRSGNVPAGEKDRLSKAWFLAVLMLPTWIATHRESKRKIFYFLSSFSVARIFSVPPSTTRSSFTFLAIDSNRYFHSYEKDEGNFCSPTKSTFIRVLFLCSPSRLFARHFLSLPAGKFSFTSVNPWKFHTSHDENVKDVRSKWKEWVFMVWSHILINWCLC